MYNWSMLLVLKKFFEKGFPSQKDEGKIPVSVAE